MYKTFENLSRYCIHFFLNIFRLNKKYTLSRNFREKTFPVYSNHFTKYLSARFLCIHVENILLTRLNVISNVSENIYFGTNYKA